MGLIKELLELLVIGPVYKKNSVIIGDGTFSMEKGFSKIAFFGFLCNNKKEILKCPQKQILFSKVEL